MMRAVEDVVRTAGYRTVLSAHGRRPRADEIDVVRSLARGYADGLILSPLRVTPELVRELEQARRPVVVVGSLPPGTAIDNVRADSPGGVRLALTHLRDGGRRRIGFLNGPAGHRSRLGSRARLPPYGQAPRTSAERRAERRARRTSRTTPAARSSTELLDQDDPPDAVLGANDLLAVAVINAITERGGRVPEDIAVVGMDDTELASYIRPSLTSVSLGSGERGRIAAELLLARIADPRREVQRVTVTPRLTIRVLLGARAEVHADEHRPRSSRCGGTTAPRRRASRADPRARLDAASGARRGSWSCRRWSRSRCSACIR